MVDFSKADPFNDLSSSDRAYAAEPNFIQSALRAARVSKSPRVGI